MKKICISGLNPSWQKTVYFSRLTLGGVNRAEDLDLISSGKGINTARAVKTWGLAEPTVYQFLAGDNGKKIRQDLWREKISHISIETSGETRTCSTLLAEGNATEIIEPSPKVSPLEAASLFQAFCAGVKDADALAICGTCPPGINEFFYAKVAEEARKNGVYLLVDCCQNIIPLLEAGADFLKINRGELALLTGEQDIQSAYRYAFRNWQIQVLAVTDGPDAAYSAQRDGALYRIAIPRIRAVNPIGSGDTCSGVTLSEILSGTDPLTAFRTGLAAASANCLNQEPACFTKEQALELLPGITAEEWK